MKVTEILDEVVKDFCDNYCKWPIVYKPERTEPIDDDWMQSLLDEKCKACPFNRVM